MYLTWRQLDTNGGSFCALSPFYWIDRLVSQCALLIYSNNTPKILQAYLKTALTLIQDYLKDLYDTRLHFFKMTSRSNQRLLHGWLKDKHTLALFQKVSPCDNLTPQIMYIPAVTNLILTKTYIQVYVIIFTTSETSKIFHCLNTVGN